jgi:dolichyl-phosphate-mannose-protein mannosyltransferase
LQSESNTSPEEPIEEVTSGQTMPEIPTAGITREETFANLPAPTPKTRWQRILHWEHLGLIAIVAVTLIFHFFAIMRPQTIVWDEKWYVGDARSFLSGTGELRPEHPPLGKLFILAGEYIFNGFSVPERDTGATTREIVTSYANNDTSTIDVSDATKFNSGNAIRIDSEQMEVKIIDFNLNRITVERGTGGTVVAGHSENEPITVYTDNAFGWRFFSIVFGTLGIIIFYFICRSLKLSRKTTLIATFLFATEDMTFLHSGLALLDVYMVTFLLAAVLMYLNGSYLLSAVFVALSAEGKLVGVLILFAIFVHWVIYRRDKWELFAGMLILSALSFVFFNELFDFLLKGSFENPVTRIRDMLTGTSANMFTEPKLSISSRPWTWIYPQWVQLYYNSPNVPFIVYSYDPQYISFISSTIQIFIVPVVGYLIFKMVKKSQAAGLLVLWFLFTYVVWIPLDIITNRVTFVFYFLATTPAICIGVAMALSDITGLVQARTARAGKLTPGAAASYGGIIFYLMLHFAVFIVFNPAIPTLIKTWLPPFTIGVK